MNEHGYVAYTRGCRCEICREAKAIYMREKRARARAYATPALIDERGRYVADIPHHGLSGYQEHSCRCAICSAAKAAAMNRQYQAHKASA